MCKCNSTRKLAEAEQRIVELEASNIELRHTLLSCAGRFESCLNRSGAHSELDKHLLEKFYAVLKRIEKQSLAKHDAAVIRKALDYVQSRQLDQSDVDMMDANLLDYANKLKAGKL